MIIFSIPYFFRNQNFVYENTPDYNLIKEYHLTLGMVGDALYHSGVYKDGLQINGTYNFDYQLSEISPLIHQYDLAFYNQESILGGSEIGLSSYPRFNSPKEVGDAFIKAGFNLVSLANNHTLDRGEKAIINSTNYWNNTPVITAGSYQSQEDLEKTHVHQKNGIKFAFFSYTDTTNGLKTPAQKDYLVNIFDKEKVKNDIAKVQALVDVIIVSMHWGSEYTHIPTTIQKEEAQYLSSLGVDIIIGNHPHVIQPIEYINNTIVFYSLGNFISAQDGLNKRIGLLASLDINKTILNNKTTITINNIKGDLLYTHHNGYRKFKVIPFYKLNTNILPDYENIKKNYEKILNANDPFIQIGTLS